MENKKIEICLVIHSLQAGGMERVMSELANYFATKPSVTVHLILYGIKRDIFYQLNPAISIHKPTFAFNDRLRTISTLRTIWYLRKTVTKIQPDTVLSFGEYWNNFVLLSMVGTSIPVFVSDRSQPDKSLGKLHEWLRTKLYPYAKGVIVQTSVAKLIYEKKYSHSNTRVIGNPIREIMSVPEAERHNIILMVGRLIRTKNQDRLIRIFSKVQRGDWRLVIVGYDHLKQENENNLKRLADELGIGAHVEFAGKRADVDNFYKRAKIFAFTSSSEGFPNVIGEAMSAGLPVVSYDCIAGPSDLISDGHNGFLVPLFDDETFAQKLHLLMSDEDLRSKFGRNAATSMRPFGVENVGENFFQFMTNHN